MSPDARFMCGLSLILIPTIVYGGLTILSVITGGQVGTQGPENLSASQIAFGEPVMPTQESSRCLHFSFKSRWIMRRSREYLCGQCESGRLLLRFSYREDSLRQPT
jgi:hypothetical protein